MEPEAAGDRAAGVAGDAVIVVRVVAAGDGHRRLAVGDAVQAGGGQPRPPCAGVPREPVTQLASAQQVHTHPPIYDCSMSSPRCRMNSSALSLCIMIWISDICLWFQCRL